MELNDLEDVTKCFWWIADYTNFMNLGCRSKKYSLSIRLKITKCYKSIRKHIYKLSVLNQSANTDKGCQSLIYLKPRTAPRNILFISYIVHMNLAQGPRLKILFIHKNVYGHGYAPICVMLTKIEHGGTSEHRY